MEQGPITALDLMERAGAACVRRIVELHGKGDFGGADRFVVLAGMGNNGGDGFVIARLLHLAGLPVRIVYVLHRNEPSNENALNLQQLRSMGIEIDAIDHSIIAIHIIQNEIVIDAFIGTGITPPVDSWVGALIASVNASGRTVIAIDLPSGMVAPEDGKDFDPAACIHADLTLTFEGPRLGFLLPETGVCAGRFEILPIGLDAAVKAGADRIGDWVRASDLRGCLHPRPRFGHKGTFGHALVIAGSRGMYGAAVLALKGCLRGGVGLVTGHVPGEAAAGLTSAVPDAMCSIDTGSDHLSGVPPLDRFDAVALGPGMGQHAETTAVVEHCLRSVRGAMVLDADALNILATRPDWFHFLGPNTVLTPHPKEMDRLLGSPSKTSYERLRRAQAFAQLHECTVVLKGAYSVTCASDGKLYFNSTGNVGMAKGGSGDVLTGLLAGLLAQGYSALDACLIGVYLHGLAGDLAAEELGMDAMRPSDLVDALPTAWKTLRGTSEQAVQ